MASVIDIAILCAALGSGLVAGVFFAFSTFVMRALARLDHADGMVAMQQINVTVITPWFLVPFVGLAPLSLALGVVALIAFGDPGSLYLLAGSLVYLVGTFLVTIALHIPMNEALAVVEADSQGAEPHWHEYVSRWTLWNHVRAMAAFLAAAAFTLAYCA